jgi:hypothetical protein
MDHQSHNTVIPIYTSHGDVGAFLFYPYIFNGSGEYIGWITAEREVYSVLGIFVGELTYESRIIRERETTTLKPRRIPPSHPPQFLVPATIPLAPLMSELRFGQMDVLFEQPELLHTLDAGELKDDLE